MPQIYLQIKDLAALNPTVSLPASKQSWPEPDDSEEALNNFYFTKCNKLVHIYSTLY